MLKATIICTYNLGGGIETPTYTRNHLLLRFQPQTDG